MARRRLLNDEAWNAVMALPSEERDLVRHCTLSAEDFDRLREVGRERGRQAEIA